MIKTFTMSVSEMRAQPLNCNIIKIFSKFYFSIVNVLMQHKFPFFGWENFVKIFIQHEFFSFGHHFKMVQPIYFIFVLFWDPIALLCQWPKFLLQQPATKQFLEGFKSQVQVDNPLYSNTNRRTDPEVFNYKMINFFKLQNYIYYHSSLFFVCNMKYKHAKWHSHNWDHRIR